MQKCAASMFQDPVLWIRMAECCMEAYLANMPLESLKGEPTVSEAIFPFTKHLLIWASWQRSSLC